MTYGQRKIISNTSVGKDLLKEILANANINMNLAY